MSVSSFTRYCACVTRAVPLLSMIDFLRQRGGKQTSLTRSQASPVYDRCTNKNCKVHNYRTSHAQTACPAGNNTIPWLVASWTLAASLVPRLCTFSAQCGKPGYQLGYHCVLSFPVVSIAKFTLQKETHSLCFKFGNIPISALFH